MPLILQTPTVLRLQGYDALRPQLEKILSYQDGKLDFEIRAFEKNRWYAQQHGQAAYVAHLTELKKRRNQSLLFQDEQGLYTHSGLANLISTTFSDEIVTAFKRPEPKLIPWAKIPEHTNRYYQTDSEAALLAAKHAGVEICTGGGKSTIIRNLLKALGLQAVVMAPSVSIANQLYDDLVLHFGLSKVGKYFDGKKEFKKLFTVGVAASLTRIQEGTPAWEKLSASAVVCMDESHLVPAVTLAKVCFGLVKNAPYRFSFSGTQLRNDGLDLLLDAITGPIVYNFSVQQGVDQGFLAKPIFRMVKVKSDIKFDVQDVNEMTRAHLYYSPKINAIAADFVNKAVSLMGRPTLVLIDEIEQWEHLKPLLRYEAKFAQGKNNDNKDLVESFNLGSFPILVGTSCVATGTDFKTVGCIVYLRGGKSEIEVKQGVGRGTRKAPGKEDFVWIDFDITNVDALHRHANERKKLYHEIYPNYTEVVL